MSGEFFTLFFLASIVFWIWSLVDCLRAEYQNPSDKTVWFLVVLFLNLFGAVLYVLIAKNKQVKKTKKQQDIAVEEKQE